MKHGRKYNWFLGLNPFAKSELARRYDDIIHKQQTINTLAKQQDIVLSESQISVGYMAAESIRHRIEKLSETEV